MSDVVAKIKDLDYYKILAQKAFFNESLNEELVLFALESFMTRGRVIRHALLSLVLHFDFHCASMSYSSVTAAHQPA